MVRRAAARLTRHWRARLVYLYRCIMYRGGIVNPMYYSLFGAVLALRTLVMYNLYTTRCYLLLACSLLELAPAIFESNLCKKFVTVAATENEPDDSSS